MSERRTVYRTARQIIDAAQSEADFQAQVIAFAKLHGWMVYHTFRSEKSPEGFPDLVLLGHGRIIFAELKSEKGHTTREQREWLTELMRLAKLNLWVLGCFVWKPHDWPEIEELLSI